MQRKKIAIMVILLAAALTTTLLVIGLRSAGVDPAPPEETGADQKPQPDRQTTETADEKELFDQNQKEKLEQIFGNTYIYYDEFLEGKPITYTFYDDGTMVAYYWEDTESESIPLGSQWAEYSVNEEVTEITFNWDDGTKTTESFNIKRNTIVIGEAEFEISDREIYLN